MELVLILGIVLTVVGILVGLYMTTIPGYAGA
jgi:hypothetical protein